MSIAQFYSELTKGLPSPTYIFYGTDDFLLYDAFLSIKERYNFDAFNFDAFDFKSPDDTKSIQEIINILDTLPFLAEKRIVVILNIQEIRKKEIEPLQRYLSNPSEKSTLIMFFSGKNPEPFDRSIIKDLKIISLNLYDKDIPLWIKEKAKIIGYSITDRAIEYLMGTLGNDLGLIYSELKKFAALEKKIIDIKDIQGLVYFAAEYNAFDLINAINKGNKTEVFRIYEMIKEDIEPQQILGALNFQYSKIWAKQINNKKLYKNIFQLLHEADISIKTSKSLVIEELLMKLMSKKSKGVQD
jgi:DNA polymerase-3 subunit delta